MDGSKLDSNNYGCDNSIRNSTQITNHRSLKTIINMVSKPKRKTSPKEDMH